MEVVSRYGSYLLIGLGWLLFSVIIPSAAGPSDAAPRERLSAPAVRSAGAAPLLIGSPRQAPLPVVQDPVPVATATPLTVATVPAVVVPPTATAAPALPPSDRIVIPRIRLDTKVIDVGVLANGEMETAAHAVGRLLFGADAGEAGNVVLAGHNDVLGEVFRRLPELVVGDEVVLYRGALPFRYRVEGKTIVREQGASEAQRRENAKWMEQTEAAVVTLISCYPYRVDTHRYIVRARLVE
ncbi:MAG TPA: sortase [Chloroflexota bacterium]|nr:sortase [Chloroflexota bacterium]